jgi:hypothetical protein
MARIRGIHPSATLFAGVLIALLLPFGQAVEGCGAEADFSGVDLLIQDVHATEPGNEEFAEEVEAYGAPFAWALLLTGLAGLTLAVFARGALWGTLSLLAWCWTSLLSVAVCLDDAYIGWHLAFWLPAAGVAARFLAAVRRRFLGKEGQQAVGRPPGGRHSLRTDGSLLWRTV